MSHSVFSWIVDPQVGFDENDTDNDFFLRALRNSQFAMGSTHPNPAVGAVLVKDGKIVADGYTHAPGGMHAEIHAIRSATPKDVRGSTLYVTLEPCSHFGRTPPCTNAIIENGIARVVFGVTDPNPKVYGQGIAELERAGITVAQIAHPELIAMAERQLRSFHTWVAKKRPYVVIKIATSSNGFFSARFGEGTKITGPEADLIVHRMRRAADAVMVGSTTAKIDNPSLTARLSGEGHGKQPASIIVSSKLDLPLTLKLFHRAPWRSLVLTTDTHSPEALNAYADHAVEVVECGARAGKVDMTQAFSRLAELGFTCIMVEAGPSFFTHFVENNLADEIFWFRARAHLASEGPSIKNLDALINRHYQLQETVALAQEDLLMFD